MKVRITFRSEIYFEGENLEDIASQFEALQIYNEDAVNMNGLSFCEIVSVEDEETGEDIESEFNEVY